MIRQFIKAWERVKEVHTSGGKIFIRGAGNNGRVLLGDLAALGVKVSAFIDCNTALVGGEIKGVPVISPDEVYDLAAGSHFILSSVNSGDVYAELRCEMEDHGLTEGYDFADFGLNCDWRMYSEGVDFREEEEPCYDKRATNILHVRQLQKGAENAISSVKNVVPMPYIEDEYNVFAHVSLAVTKYCSLRCQGCVNAIPYCKHPRHFDPETIVGDLDKLLSVSHTLALNIIGGESLIHPRIADIFRLIGEMRHRDHISYINILTNGTIVPSASALENYARLGNALISISNYGATSRRMDNLIAACREHGIPVSAGCLISKWMDAGDPSVKRNLTHDELRRLFALCGDAMCYQLFDGKLYPCARAPVLYDEGFVPPDASAACDIRNTPADELREAVHYYLYDIPYLSACDYCDGKRAKGREIPAARQMKPGEETFSFHNFSKESSR